MHRLLCLASILSLPLTALAEAGLPPKFCAETTCACGGGSTCTCGQVCNGTRCEAGSQTTFCTSDAQCTGSCGTFQCMFNVCRNVDGGVAPGGAGGSTGAGGSAGAGGGRGCSVAPGAFALLLGAALSTSLARRRRKAHIA
jgi:hypothetical protein